MLLQASRYFLATYSVFRGVCLKISYIDALENLIDNIYLVRL